MIYVMYVPSRISFLVWGPWLAARTGKNLTSLHDNMTQVDKMAIVNECADAQSQINIDPIESQINEGLDELHIIYYTLWTCWALLLVEFLCWMVYGTYHCMTRAERDAKRHNLGIDEYNYMVVQSNNDGKMIVGVPQAPMIGQPQPQMMGQQQ